MLTFNCQKIGHFQTCNLQSPQKAEVTWEEGADGHWEQNNPQTRQNLGQLNYGKVWMLYKCEWIPFSQTPKSIFYCCWILVSCDTHCMRLDYISEEQPCFITSVKCKALNWLHDGCMINGILCTTGPMKFINLILWFSKSWLLDFFSAVWSKINK